MNTASVILLGLLAQTAPALQASPEKAKAQQLLTDGATLYQNGDYTGALDKFHAAYAAYPSPKIWFNIGQANRDLGRPVEALEAFQKFLSSATDASRELRAAARDSVADLQKQLGQLTVVCDADGAVLTIDGKAVGLTPLGGPVWVVPGTHQVLAHGRRTAPAVGRAEVSAGGKTTLVLKIGQLAMPTAAGPPFAPASAAASAPAADVGSPEPPRQQGQGWWLNRRWTWVAGGSTVLLAVGATAISATVKSRFDELYSSCGGGSTNRPGCEEGDISSLSTRQTTANVLWGLTAAAAVTTGVLFFVEGRPVVVTPVAGAPRGLMAQVRF